MRETIIIGLTGPQGGGKDTAADWFKQQGFAYFSCSDIIRQECNRLGLEQNRDNLINIGNQLREKYGAGILAEKILQQIDEQKIAKALVVSIRNSSEVAALRKNENFFLLNISAEQKIRYDRISSRGRCEDNVTFEQFTAQEAREANGSATQQQLTKVAELADTVIDNNQDFAHLYRQLENFYQNLK
jgi:dephospho-CoA kinase